MSIDLLFLTCPPPLVAALVEQLKAQLEERPSAARVVRSGVMCKGRDGFIILACPYPDGFHSAFLDAIGQMEELHGYMLLRGDEPGAAVTPEEVREA
jgi:hypothetical protein